MVIPSNSSQEEAFAEYPVWLDFITTTLAAEGLTL